MAVNLVKGQKISLSKESNGLAHLLVGLGWDLPKGLFQKAFDLDAFALVCGTDGKIDSMRDPVSFRQTPYLCVACVHRRH